MSTEAEFLVAVLAAKHVKHSHAMLTELGFSQNIPTDVCCDNQSAIKMTNSKMPAERSRHIGIQHFAIQDWKDQGVLTMCCIPGIVNPADDLAKPLGWVSHSRHCRRMMGHCQ